MIDNVFSMVYFEIEKPLSIPKIMILDCDFLRNPRLMATGF